jgi:two-component system chemotaxis sensor kinase CheA
MVGGRRAAIEVDVEEHEALEAEASKFSVDLQRRIRALKLEPTRRRFEHFGEQARRIAKRLDKSVDIAIEDAGLRVDPKVWAQFWSTLVHAIRNAVDHGIEHPVERAALGKPECGLVTLRSSTCDGRFVIEVEDDGRGVDWEGVRRAAERAGACAVTSDDLEAALFRDGLSTATELTDVSGRGIGMGALLASANALGGEVSVSSERGLFTRIRVSFPCENMAQNLVAPRDALRSAAA